MKLYRPWYLSKSKYRFCKGNRKEWTQGFISQDLFGVMMYFRYDVGVFVSNRAMLLELNSYSGL